MGETKEGPPAIVPEVMTVEQFARAYGSTPKCVRERCYRGSLPSTKAGALVYVLARQAFGLPEINVIKEGE